MRSRHRFAGASPAPFTAHYYDNWLASPSLKAEISAAIRTYKVKPTSMNGSTTVTAAIEATVRNCQGTRTYAQNQPAGQNGNIPAPQSATLPEGLQE
jgi:hypothetical protein